MELASDDDSSVASSGDEMLNMVVPFSQESTNSATQKVKGKKSESEDEDDDSDDNNDDGAGGGGEEIMSKKRKRIVEENNAENIQRDDVVLANATNAFRMQFSDQKIGTTKKLYWNERRQKKSVAIYPVRVVPREEVVGLCLKDWDAESERAVQYIQYPHKQSKKNLGLYDVVSVRSLTPYNGSGPKDAWCTKKIQQYSKQLKRTLKGATEVDLITEQHFLSLVLKQSLKEEEYEKERNALLDKAAAASLEGSTSDKEDEQQAENDSDNDEDDDDDIDIGCSSGRRSRLCRGNNVKSEPLRVGDVIEYYKPQSVAGNPDALCEAEVKFINPKGDPILITTDVFTILPPDHQVKRVKRMHRGKLLDHDGRFRAINSYVLKKEGVSAVDT